VLRDSIASVRVSWCASASVTKNKKLERKKENMERRGKENSKERRREEENKEQEEEEKKKDKAGRGEGKVYFSERGG
jgi:hypothetical protein